MSEHWFYRLFGEEFGPVPLSDLRELSANGTLTGDDEVRPATISIWVPAKSVCELQDVFQTTAIESDSRVANSESPAADEWYYQQPNVNEAVIGPMTFEALLEQAKAGRLSADDEVKFGVDGKWRRAGSMGRLVAVLPYRSAPRNVQAIPKPVPVAQALSIADLEDAPSEVAEESPNDDEVVVNQPVMERKTPQPKTKPSKGKKGPSVAAKAKQKALDESIEDEMLAELMAPPAASENNVGESASESRTTVPLAPANQRAFESVPQSAVSNFGSSATSSYVPPSPPQPVAPKPVPRFKPSRSDNSLMERLKDPRLLKPLAIVAGLLLIVGWMSMPEGNAGDVKLYNELNNLITEVRAKRGQDPKVLPSLKDELEKTADRIAKTLEKTADGDHPARQRLLWCAKTTVPQMTKFGLAIEAVAEKQVVAQLDQTAVLLGLKPSAPSVAVAELVTD